MNILSITGILPIPGVLKHNDFVFHIYKIYCNKYPTDSVEIIRTTQYKTNIKKIIQSQTDIDKLNKKYVWDIFGFRVSIFPFYSMRRLRNTNAISSFSAYFLNKKRLNKIISEFKPDLIHAQYIFPDGCIAYMLNKRYRIPYVITTHGELFFFKYFLARKIGLKVLRRASYVVPINYSSYQYFIKAGIKPIKYLPLGFDKSFVRDQRPASGSVVNIVTVADLIKLKNIDKVITALPKLSCKNSFRYTIIGKGPEKAKLTALVQKLGLSEVVTFIDHVPHDEIASELHKYDIFIMPSYLETFGRVYFEAMAMGIPIICARNTGIFGFFKEGEQGLSVDHRNTDDIAEKLEYLISNPVERSRIGKAGKQLVEKYTWETIIEEIHQIYESVTDQKTQINE
jgi:glycosyltransferase involved in cell wall biosynthesis